MDGDNRTKIIASLSKIYTLSRIYSDNCKEFKEFVHKLWTQDMTGKEKADIIESVGRWHYISSPHRDQFISFVQSLLTDEMNPRERAKLIISLARHVSNEENWEECKDYFKAFFTEDMTPQDKLKIIKALPHNSIYFPREDFVEYVLSLISRNVQKDECVELITLFARFTWNEKVWGELKTYIDSCFTDDMTGQDKVHLIQIFEQIFDKYRATIGLESFIENIQPLISLHMPKDERVELISHLAAFRWDEEEWRIFKTYARACFTEDMTGQDKVQLIQALDQHRYTIGLESFIEHIQPLISSQMSKEERIALISKLAGLRWNGEEWRIFKTYARTCFTEDMTGQEKVQLIQVLDSHVLERGLGFVEYTQTFISPHMPKEDRIELVNIIDRLYSGGELEHYILHLQDLEIELPMETITPRIRRILNNPLNRFMIEDANEMVEIAQELGYNEGVDIHRSSRDARTAEAYSILLESQHDIPRDEFDDAFKEFMSNVRDYPDIERQLKIEYVLGLKRNPIEGFGGLLDEDHELRTLNLSGIKGKELLGRLWHYASHFAFKVPDLTDVQRAREHKNAQASVFAALVDSIETDGHVVCDPGKLQRLAVSVLQGRLKGVNIDGMLTATETSELVCKAWEEYKQEHPVFKIDENYIAGFEIDFNNKHPNADTQAFEDTLTYIHELEDIL